MKKIIHHTDLHIGIPRCTATFDKIVYNIKARMTLASDYVIVVTGDLVDTVDDSFTKVCLLLIRK
ncbi:MAG: hypothetical protein D3924_12885 [Candidatus Electrothrix sp. AR4]|nr:hypothetical protein [Candidatus Electrothrix sp. AR4]